MKLTEKKANPIHRGINSRINALDVLTANIDLRDCFGEKLLSFNRCVATRRELVKVSHDLSRSGFWGFNKFITQVKARLDAAQGQELLSGCLREILESCRSVGGAI